MMLCIHGKLQSLPISALNLHNLAFHKCRSSNTSPHKCVGHSCLSFYFHLFNLFLWAWLGPWHGILSLPFRRLCLLLGYLLICYLGFDSLLLILLPITPIHYDLSPLLMCLLLLPLMPSLCPGRLTVSQQVHYSLRLCLSPF